MFVYLLHKYMGVLPLCCPPESTWVHSFVDIVSRVQSMNTRDNPQLHLCVSQLFFQNARKDWGRDNQQLSKDVEANIGELQTCRYGSGAQGRGMFRLSMRSGTLRLRHYWLGVRALR